MNSNAQAVNWSNTRARVLADILAGAYISAKKALMEWQTQGLGTLIPNDSVQLADGSPADGRPPITDAQVNAVVARCQEFVNWLETGQLAAGGTATMANLASLSSVSVNARASF